MTGAREVVRSVQARVATDLESHVALIRDWVRQPSVSLQAGDLRPMASLAADTFDAIGCGTVEIVDGEAHPAVWGYLDAGAPVTLHVYGMLDTAPADPQYWLHDPWGGDLLSKDGFKRVLVGRGSLAAKGPLVAFLNAVASIRAVTGTLPVNLAILAESEELLASPTYDRLVKRFHDRLKHADASYCLGPAQSPNGTVWVGLGLKGLVQVELIVDARGSDLVPAAPLRSAFAALATNPAARLAHAISSLVGPNGTTSRVPELAADGSSTGVDDIPLCELAGVLDETAAWPWSDAPITKAALARQADPLTSVLLGTTMTVSGMASGFLGPATGTMPFSVPHEARAMLEVRSAAQLRPEEVVAAIRRHLDEQGFPDVALRIWGAHAPHRSDPAHPIVKAVIDGVMRDGFRPIVWPLQAGGGAWSALPDAYGVPCIRGGLPGGGHNGIDEYLVVDGDERTGGLLELEYAHVDRLFAVAAAMV